MRNTKETKNIVKVLNTLATVFLVVAILFTALSFLELPTGIRIFNVMSGSMEPTIKTGSAILVKRINNVNVGDVVTFQSSQSRNLTTHRVVESYTTNGEVVYATKGDANDSNDYGYMSKENIVGKVIFDLPLLGYFSDFVKSMWGLLAMIVLPGLLIIYEEIRNIVKSYKEIKQYKKIAI